MASAGHSCLIRGAPQLLILTFMHRLVRKLHPHGRVWRRKFSSCNLHTPANNSCCIASTWLTALAHKHEHEVITIQTAAHSSLHTTPILWSTFLYTHHPHITKYTPYYVCPYKHTSYYTAKKRLTLLYAWLSQNDAMSILYTEFIFLLYS